jgi:hypothetical protein
MESSGLCQDFSPSFKYYRKDTDTYNSETPHTKLFKGLQSGELGGKTSFSHTSGKFSSLTCRGPWL